MRQLMNPICDDDVLDKDDSCESKSSNSALGLFQIMSKFTSHVHNYTCDPSQCSFLCQSQPIYSFWSGLINLWYKQSPSPPTASINVHECIPVHQIDQTVSTGVHKVSANIEMSHYHRQRKNYRAKNGTASCHSTLITFLVSFLIIRNTDGCSPRSTPKPNYPHSVVTKSYIRPTIEYQTFACPENYATWFCLNEARCFTLQLDQEVIYNCECAKGFMGKRCEYKDLIGSYNSMSQKKRLTRNTRGTMIAGIISRNSDSSTFLIFSGSFCLIALAVLVSFFVTRRRTKAKLRRLQIQRNVINAVPNHSSELENNSSASSSWFSPEKSKIPGKLDLGKNSLSYKVYKKTKAAITSGSSQPISVIHSHISPP